MFLTDEILEKYNACGIGRKLFNKLYPNGVEIMDLLDNKHIPKEMLWWGETWLPVSDEELNKLYKVLEIEDSFKVSFGKKIKKSLKIYKSHQYKYQQCRLLLDIHGKYHISYNFRFLLITSI